MRSVNPKKIILFSLLALASATSHLVAQDPPSGPPGTPPGDDPGTPPTGGDTGDPGGTPALGSFDSISTRAFVSTGNPAIAGLIVDEPTTIVFRAIGPTLGTAPHNLSGVLPDPNMVVRGPTGETIAINDNSADFTGTVASPGTPPNALESYYAFDVEAGAYTAEMYESNSQSGTALIQAYNVISENNAISSLSTRARVGIGDGEKVVGGIIIVGNPSETQTIVIRAIGPTLGAAPHNLPNVLSDPTLTVFNALTNEVIAQNDNHGDHVGTIPPTPGAPPHPLESIAVLELAPGAYTAEITGVGDTTGTALVQMYIIKD